LGASPSVNSSWVGLFATSPRPISSSDDIKLWAFLSLAHFNNA
jgi:hypothetical protein